MQYDPKTMDEYIDMVHQAVYEVDELRACIEDDEEEMERYLPFIDQLDNYLRALYEALVAGHYRLPGDADLPFMPVVAHFGHDIPFKDLLQEINRVHRQGLSQP